MRFFPTPRTWLYRALFEPSPLGDIPAAPEWTGERIEWLEENARLAKPMFPNEGYQLLQGEGVARGRLIGGCIEVLEMLKGTALWPEPAAFEGALLFLETSEETPDPRYILYWLRNYAAQGILQARERPAVFQALSGRVFGRVPGEHP